MLGSGGRGRRDDVSEAEKGKDFRSTQAALGALVHTSCLEYPTSITFLVIPSFRSSTFRWGLIGTPTVRPHCYLYLYRVK